MNCVTENFLKRLASVQETEFVEILTGRVDSKNDKYELPSLLDAYKLADSDKQKIMILSAINPKTYTIPTKTSNEHI